LQAKGGAVDCDSAAFCYRFRKMAEAMAMTAQYVAVLIDAENVSVSGADDILAEASRHGVVRERRLYGDFIRNDDWLAKAPRYALTPRQTIGNTVGKNRADIALVIDAMEMLCRDEATVFCIATCDGDFTQLVTRIRQHGKKVIGIGRSDASVCFREACDEFKTLKPAEALPASLPEKRLLEPDLLRRIFTAANSDWVQLSELKNSLQMRSPGFDPNAYGYDRFWQLLEASGVELGDKNRQGRLKPLKKVVDNGRPSVAAVG
jgi:hypothetical protein